MYQPPTDSLYKFCAISGIVVILFSIYYPHTLIIDLSCKVNDVTQEIEVNMVNSAYLKSKIIQMKEILSNAKSQQRGDYVSDPNKLELAYSDSEIKDLLMKIEEMNRDIGIASATLEHNHEETGELLSEIKKIKWLSLTAGVLGCLLASYGFRRWYYRIQIYQDRMLATSSKRATETEQEEN